MNLGSGSYIKSLLPMRIGIGKLNHRRIKTWKQKADTR